MAHKVQKGLEKAYEGTTTVNDIELYIFKDKYTKFQMSSEESIPEMFRTVNVIVYKLRRLGQNMGDDVFSHQFLRCLPKKFKNIVTMILRGGLKNLTSTQVLGEDHHS